MTDFGIGNYPPGVTGNELQIAGPDFERESEVPCAKCNGPQMYWTYGEQAHVTCQDCEETVDLDIDQDDPEQQIKEEHRERLVSTYQDAVYDDERDRQMVQDVPLG